ncbi:Pantothenate transporter liz1 [Colletotrichum tanaceti]|uniref:Pantothenate transporter liz1 n=1 Tax=Colletotrichum tanaceti TaxID=1306861 RepID=A0A4U6XMJ2_9PEZI|nr:Pantothenate transporter liz1 [Colletotrichum tanaceti]TKW56882.1 Pantothenate transporter liz1 [Colletotrichum tanaceti]
MPGSIREIQPQGTSTDEKSVSVLHEGKDLDSATPSVTEVLQKTPKSSWKSYIWDTFDKSPEERRFLFKLDAVLMTLASLGYFIKYLDQVNINNAFVSGMKEDLGLYGNELNYMQVCWTVGYVVGEIPSNMLLTRIRPGIWIPLCEVTWSVLTILLVKCETATQIYVLRFFIGLAESTFYPGMQYIIGSWYRKDELAKRSCLFHAMGNVGSMVSGYLMAGSHNLDGVHGFYGWQWLFIWQEMISVPISSEYTNKFSVAGTFFYSKVPVSLESTNKLFRSTVVSLPIAISGFFFMPDLPEITKAWYFTPEEIALAKRRMELEGRAQRAPYTKAKFVKIFSSWHIWSLVALYIVFNNGNGGISQPAFPLWLKAEGYGVREVNIYPTIAEVVAIVTTLVYAWTSDTVFRGARWPAMVFSGVVKIVAYVPLTIWDVPAGLKWACFILCGFGGGISGLTFAWAHEICSDDNEERALVTGAMNQMAYVFQAWLPLIIWQQVEAPAYPKGYPSMIALSVALIVIAFVIRFLHKREIRLKATAGPSVA